jgi:hypothetical protein
MAFQNYAEAPDQYKARRNYQRTKETITMEGFWNSFVQVSLLALEIQNARFMIFLSTAAGTEYPGRCKPFLR